LRAVDEHQASIVVAKVATPTVRTGLTARLLMNKGDA
jgi:hypothetical protein